MENYLFIGLGNPGIKYQRTRHNLGIRVLRDWVTSVSEGSAVWREEASVAAEVAEVVVNDARVHCLFPLTYMNKSGQAVAAFLRNNPVDVKNILIIHDELELLLGEVKIKEGGSAAGHRGVKSIHEALATQDMPRLRLGIGRPNEAIGVDEYVLQRFTPEEEGIVEQVIKKASEEMTNIVIRKS